MRATTTNRARALVGAAAAAALAVTGLVAMTAPAQAVVPASVTANKTTNLSYEGEQITVTGSNYAAGVVLYVAECDTSKDPGSACDFANFKQVTVASNGTFSTPLFVRGAFTGTDCWAVGSTCAIETSNSTNPLDMSSYATKALSFVPTLKLSSSTVKVGDVVKLTGTHFPTAPTQIFVTICADPPTATNCDMNLPDIGAFAYDGSGGFTFNFTVKATSFLSGDGQIDCSKVACVIGTTNGNNPGDRSYNSTAAITVAPVATAPGKAKITTAKQKGKKKVLLKWRAAKAHGTPVTKYRVEVKKAKKHWKKAGVTSPSKTKLKWKNGKVGNKYKFRVIAKSAAGSSTSKVVAVRIK